MIAFLQPRARLADVLRAVTLAALVLAAPVEAAFTVDQLFAPDAAAMCSPLDF
jgi:hypothetical protein